MQNKFHQKMLSTIKDKILNVKKNVPLFTNASSEKKIVQSKSFNLSAGSDILSHFQNEWQTLHVTNEANTKKAEEASKIIIEMTTKIDKDKENLGLITHLLVNSNLRKNISRCTKQISELHSSFKVVEDDLLQLENLLENVEFETMKKQHRYHMQQYKLRKSDTLMKLEEQLKVQYEQSVTEHEEKKKKELDERQQVFQDAFKNDLETFKSLGALPKLDLPKQPSALLEEIQLDYDENELDQFFADTPSSK